MLRPIAPGRSGVGECVEQPRDPNAREIALSAALLSVSGEEASGMSTATTDTLHPAKSSAARTISDRRGQEPANRPSRQSIEVPRASDRKAS
jgi:hypothetical protein